MKLVALVLGILLAAPTAAVADDVLYPPGGPVPAPSVGGEPPALASPPLAAGDAPEATPPRVGGRVWGGAAARRGGARDPERAARAARLRAALLEGFDANGDGRLGPRERARAARALHRMERRLSRPAGADARAHLRAQRVQRMIQRFDRDRDGHLGPGEVSPAASHRLRGLDRDRDGWVEPGEY
jgi:hypothetical protein